MRRPIGLLMLVAATTLTLMLVACSSTDGPEQSQTTPLRPAPTAQTSPQTPAATVPSTSGGTTTATARPTPVSRATPAVGAEVVNIERGGVVSYAVHAAFSSFDLHWESGYIATQLLTPIYNGLLIRDITTAGDDPAGQLRPDLAESWEALDGGQKYAFNLREDATWNDGSEFSCEDVESTFAKWNNASVSTRGTQFPTMGSFRCTDESTFEVNFDVPQGSFLTAIGSARFEMHKKEITDQVEMFRQGITKDPHFLVGTGPYMVDTWNHGVEFVAQRRTDYWKMGEDGDPLPYLDGYKAVVMGDLSAIFAAFRARQLTMGGIARHLEKNEADIIERDGLDATVLVGPRNAFHNIRFNLEKPPTNDIRVRKAIWLAIDQRATIQAAVEGWGSVGTFIGPHLPFGIPEDEMLAHEYFSTDMEARRLKARELLAEAGFAEGLELTLQQRQGPLYDRGVIVNQADLKKVGVNVEIRPLDTPTAFAVSGTGDFNLLTLPGSPLLDDPDGYWSFFQSWQSPRINGSRYKSDKFDRLYAQQSGEINLAKRIEITREIDRLLLEDLPSHRSYYWFQSMAHWNNLQEFHMNFGDNVYNFGKWEKVWCKTGQCQ